MNLLRCAHHALTRGVVTSRHASTVSKNLEQNAKELMGYHGTRMALRDACRCPQCVDQSSRQRDFHFAYIPNNIQGAMQRDPDGNFRVRWTDDIPGFENHESTYTPADVERVKNLPRHNHKSTTALWGRSIFESETSHVPYDQFMHEDTGLVKVLYLLARHGLVFLKGVPKDDMAVTTVARRIAPLRNTFYGETWNVRSVPQAVNVAYTSKYLGFHSDLSYMKEIPGFQFLHCLENTCPGGESRFVDTLKAYDVLCTENSELAQSLRKTSIRYEYDNDGHYYTDVKPIIREKLPFDLPVRALRGHQNLELERVSRVYWSPPFVGSICTVPDEDPRLTEEKIEASKAFADILERPDLVYETKMNAGTCVIFNNYRVLHARNAFDLNSGKRWLKGCYLDEQDVLSREWSLSKEIGNMDDLF